MSGTLLRSALVATILAAAVAAAVGLSQLREAPPKREVATHVPLVEVLELVPMTTQFSIRSQGTVAPVTETLLSAEVSGAIVQVSPKFLAGGLFAANEVLLRIDPTDYDVAVKQAEALVRQRQIEFDGIARLRDQGYRAETEYASAAAALASAEAELVRAQRNRERTEIRLPYAGLVRRKSVDLGQFVAPGTPLGVVFATDLAEVRLPLADEDLAFVDLPAPSAQPVAASTVGPAVTLTAVQKGQPRHWPATIVRTEGVIDERSRMTYAVARIDDPYRLAGEGPPLPVGSFVTASIRGRAIDDLVRIPRSALRASNQALFVDRQGRLAVATVEPVRSDGASAYLRAADLPTSRAVLTVLDTPVDGMAVRVTGADGRFAAHASERP